MKACRVHSFGGPATIVVEEIPVPTPGPGEVLVEVVAAGIGPWDAWIRAGKSVLPQPLPLTLGSDLAGVVRAVGEGVTGFAMEDEVYGVTNTRFTNACAERALATASMIAKKPRTVDFVTAAGIPVVAVTAWQMLDRAAVGAGKSVVVHGAAGNVGAYAVQLAKARGARVIATGREGQLAALRENGADEAIRSDAPIAPASVDAVIDLVGTSVHAWSFAALRRGGVLVSAVSEPDRASADERGVDASFLLVAVNTQALTEIARLFDERRLEARVGEILALSEIRTAHEMLDGTRAHADGKIVIRV